MYCDLFWKKHVSWTNCFYKKNISKIKENYKKFPYRNRWNCNCHVIHDDDYDVKTIDFNYLRKEYTKICAEFCTERKYNSFNIGDIWYNFYKKNQYQEPHIHESTFTVIHYVRFNRFFHNETKFVSNIMAPRVNQGDLIIFPGNLEHYVPKNNSFFPRLTIAFGLNITS